ncbi:N-acetyllactosaminide 3-alpha-galactosyltransferase, partial [Opisthorchis viverrini]
MATYSALIKPLHYFRMRWRKRYMLLLLLLSITFFYFLSRIDRFTCVTGSHLDCNSTPFLLPVKSGLCVPPLNLHFSPVSHRLAVIIPFRERFTELHNLLPHLAEFLSSQGVSHSFYVVNQVDTFRFNRAALLNVGVQESLEAESKGVLLKLYTTDGIHKQVGFERYLFPQTDYLVLHDVDLLPLDPALSYSWPPETGPVHLIPATIHPRYYWVKNYFGGVVVIRREHFNQVNGFSNSFWGWGWEDDEFRLRVLRSGLSINTPSNVTYGFKAFRIIHNDIRHSRDVKTYSNPEVKQLLRELRGGLDTTNYTVVARRLMHIDGVPALLIDVSLRCNTNILICNWPRGPRLLLASRYSLLLHYLAAHLILWKQPAIRQLSCSSQEEAGSPKQTEGNLKDFIVRRRSLEVNVGYDTICRTHPADQVYSDWPGRHLARDSLIVRRDGGSITAFALPPPTKTVATTIGGASHDAVGWPGSTLSMRDSPERVHTPSLNEAVTSRWNDPSRRFSACIGTQAVHTSGIAPPSGFTTRVPIAVDSVFFTPHSGSVSAVPFAVVDTAVCPPCINQVHTATSNHPAQCVFYRTNSISSARPPLPPVESEVAIGQTAVRISASKGCGFVVSTSNARELRLVASNVADRRQAYILHSSGSCESLQSHTIKLDVRPSRRTASGITRSSRTGSSLDRSGSFIFVGQQSDTIMPNSPSSGGLGSAKASCSATSHGTHHQTRITPPPDCSISGRRSSPGCSHNNVFGISPVIVPSSGKPSPNPTLTSLKALHPPKKQVKQEQYFRVQLPCTRAASRSKDFVVTDSLKLYENQISNHCEAAQRPQSWCIDLGPAVDELPLAGDSHSVSPTSTVSSLSSSSSSDASQDYREVARRGRAYQGEIDSHQLICN